MDINTIVNVVTILIAIGNFIFIFSITRKIEGIKNSYATSLETHKIELQKEFEKSKHTISLCQKLDEKLIEILLECHILLGETISFGGTEFFEKKYIEERLCPLFAFLNKYSSRYSSNDVADSIIKLSKTFEYITMNRSAMEAQAEVEEDNNFDFEKEYHEISSDVLFASSRLLSVLLPPLNNGKDEGNTTVLND